MNFGMLMLSGVFYMHCLPSGMIPEVNGVDLESLDHDYVGIIQVWA